MITVDILNHSVLGLAAILLLPVSGCQIYPLKKAPTPTPDIPEETRQEKEEIRTLLEAAELAIQKDQLLYPKEDNAYVYFSSILRLDTGNIEARRGFEKIIERYIELSIKAIDRKQFNRAQSMLDRARLIDNTHPSINPTQKQLDLVSSSTIDILEIGNKKIDPLLAQQIVLFSLKQPKKHCRFLISANNDEQGRLIYQKLKGAQNHSKLIAQIEIKRPIQIERQCFDR